MEERALVILGGTVTAVALAKKRPDALILAEGALLGGEFLSSMNIKRDDGQPLSPETEALRKECRDKDVLGEDGRLYAAPIQAILAEHLSACGAKIRFLARILDVEKMEDGFLIRYADMEGTHAVMARQVVDTRNQGGHKGICVMLDSDEGVEAPEDGGFQVLKGHLPGECVVKWPLSPDATWMEARRIAHEGMQRLPGRRMAALAPFFCYDHDAPVCERRADGMMLCMSASYAHLFAAWEGGIACATAL